MIVTGEDHPSIVREVGIARRHCNLAADLRRAGSNVGEVIPRDCLGTGFANAALSLEVRRNALEHLRGDAEVLAPAGSGSHVVPARPGAGVGPAAERASRLDDPEAIGTGPGRNGHAVA